MDLRNALTPKFLPLYPKTSALLNPHVEHSFTTVDDKYRDTQAATVQEIRDYAMFNLKYGMYITLY